MNKKVEIEGETDPFKGSHVRRIFGDETIGISVSRAEFIHAVNNADDIPETNFSILSPTKSRKVQMWWIPGDGLLCFQHEKYFFVPNGMVKFVKFG